MKTLEQKISKVLKDHTENSLKYSGDLTIPQRAAICSRLSKRISQKISGEFRIHRVELNAREAKIYMLTYEPLKIEEHFVSIGISYDVLDDDCHYLNLSTEDFLNYLA